jgi:hypothetical protein
MLRLTILTTILAMTTGLATAAPLTLTFQSPSDGCAVGVTSNADIFVEESHCSVPGASVYQYLDVGESLIITASDGTSFDFLGANILYFWDELFKLPVADVPSGLDLTDPDDIFQANADFIWQVSENELPLISIEGFQNGARTHEWSEPLLGTDGYLLSIGSNSNSNSIDLDPRDFPGVPMSDIDRLEISLAPQLVTASFNNPVLINDVWYVRDTAAPIFVFDDVSLNVTPALIITPPDPDPVPLPFSVLLLPAIGALAVFTKRA